MSAEPTFTPGPWSTVLFERPGIVDADGFDIILGGDDEIDGHGDYGIRGRSGSDDEAAANATLIAGAPSLYYALVRVEEMANAAGFRPDASYSLCNNIRDLARTALAKARGE